MKTIIPIKVTKQDLLEQIPKIPNGRFFTVFFIKKDGSIRKLTGRFGVKKHLQGGKTTVPLDKYFIIWDSAIQEYRAVNKETIFQLNFGKKTYVMGPNV